jgi:NADH:quinone reductase (non-electrogenic)
LKKKLLIIGGGFAGFWSAISSIRQSRELQKRDELEVTLINPDNYVTIRPRLNELSIGTLQFDLDKYLRPLGIHLIFGRVETVYPAINAVVLSTRQGKETLHYDYLIVSSGAALKGLNIPGAKNAFKVDSAENIQVLEDHIIKLGRTNFQEKGASTFLVVGSELAGLETASSIEQKARTIQAYQSGKRSRFKVILLQNDTRVASPCSDCQKYIADVLKSKKVEVLTTTELTGIEPTSVLLANGKRIHTRTVIWTNGMEASALTSSFNVRKDMFNRVCVDRFLKMPGYANVVAAGNVAHISSLDENNSLMDCHYAQFEGRWAGHNAINDLFNKPLKEYLPSAYLPCIDLGEPEFLHMTDAQKVEQQRRYKERAKQQHINSVTMYPWQDVEETVKASYPEFPKF